MATRGLPGDRLVGSSCRPAAALDALIGKVRAIDMDEVHRDLNAYEANRAAVAKVGGV